MSQQVNVYRKLKLFPGAVVEGSWNGNFDQGGHTYYVNNITGASGNDGLSWNSPVDQVSTAITLSEASRIVHPGTTTNDYIPNTIVIQGTGTAYTGITDLGERAFIIGLSAGLMRDGGSGQVRIGADDTDGCDDATNARGNTLYNVQFQGGGDTMYAFRNTAWIQRSRFQDVTFMQAAASLEACFYAAAISGSVFERCHYTTNAGSGPAVYGIQIAGQVSDNLWVGNTISGVGTTAMFALGSSNQQSGTVITENYFKTDSNTLAVGFYDASSHGNAMLCHNYFASSTYLSADISRTCNDNTVGNMTSGTGTFVSS